MQYCVKETVSVKAKYIKEMLHKIKHLLVIYFLFRKVYLLHKLCIHMLNRNTALTEFCSVNSQESFFELN